MHEEKDTTRCGGGAKTQIRGASRRTKPREKIAQVTGNEGEGGIALKLKTLVDGKK